MSVSLARSKYKQMEAAAAPDIESPYKVVLVTLTELERSLAVLVAARSQERNLPDEHFNRCFTAIYILQSSLDFEKGGELSYRLFEVYEYCRIQVLNAFKRDENSDLEQARMAVEGIKSAWIEIGPQVESRAT